MAGDLASDPGLVLAQTWTPGELLGSVRAAIRQHQRKMTAGELREEKERRRKSFLAARQAELEGEHAGISAEVGEKLYSCVAGCIFGKRWGNIHSVLMVVVIYYRI